MSRIRRTPLAGAPSAADWQPKKITFASRFASPATGGLTVTRNSLPAVSMHMAVWRDKGKAFTLEATR